MNFNKSKSLYNLTIEKKNGKSLYNFQKIENEKKPSDKEKRDKIKKIRETDPSYLLETELNYN